MVDPATLFDGHTQRAAKGINLEQLAAAPSGRGKSWRLAHHLADHRAVAGVHALLQCQPDFHALKRCWLSMLLGGVGLLYMEASTKEVYISFGAEGQRALGCRVILSRSHFESWPRNVASRRLVVSLSPAWVECVGLGQDLGLMSICIGGLASVRFGCMG